MSKQINSYISPSYGTKRNPYAGQGISTPYSSVKSGIANIDPSIRSIQEQALSRNTNLYNELGESGKNILGNLQGLRGRYEGNAAAYTQARVNPLEKELTTRQGELQRNIGLRGLSGSSFGEGALTNFSTDKQKSLGDARAQAEMENLQALTGIDAQMANTLFSQVGQQAALNGFSVDVAKERLMQELSALGLGQQQVNALAQGFESHMNRMLKRSTDIASNRVAHSQFDLNNAQGFESIASGIGSMMGGGMGG